MDLAIGIAFVVVVGVAYGLFVRWVATVANRKGYSYWASGLFTLFLPLIGLVLALLVPERTGNDRVPLRG